MKSLSRILIVSSCLLTLAAPFASAQSQTQPNEDITSSNFSLIVCDGPALPSTIQAPANYRPCNFAAAMQEVQHIINIFIIFGVVAAIIGFCYAGFLYIARGSEPSARSEANDIFKKVFIGFIIMLTAWFIVYQILFLAAVRNGQHQL